ncbi:Ig-like and fibronectin type-III domain-containing protein 1 [Aplysia californica]|uniref:Ig-like and fibronectin type-III domain-containing protein 1 n=1 Tax=Aplysia californica TaxID=6500 RepID=A0ABM1AEC9_APLCA|nr:Ig-like and fibronectin type-III domain-containing protein 1 [Aplysia californica]
MAYSHCCENAGLSRECVPECVSQQTASSSHPACRRDRPKILGCFADGQDHAVCCESSGLPAECLPLCRGHPMGSNLLVATCLSYKHEGIILSCLLESSGKMG